MNRQPRILIVDDELPILRAVTPLLRSRGYEVRSAVNGASGLSEAEADPPDLLIVDLGLPDIDGLEVCRRVRERSSVPIIVLSARHSEKDKVAALDLGADDYVTKPFGPDELLARVRACLRRSHGSPEEETGTLVRSDLTIDFEPHRVLRGEEEIRLTPKEFELLVFLARHPGKVLTHRTILRSLRLVPDSGTKSWCPRGLRWPGERLAFFRKLNLRNTSAPETIRLLQRTPLSSIASVEVR